MGCDNCDCRPECACQECLASFLAVMDPEVITYPADEMPVNEGTDEQPPW